MTNLKDRRVAGQGGHGHGAVAIAGRQIDGPGPAVQLPSHVLNQTVLSHPKKFGKFRTGISPFFLEQNHGHARTTMFGKSAGRSC